MSGIWNILQDGFFRSEEGDDKDTASSEAVPGEKGFGTGVPVSDEFGENKPLA